MFPIAIQIDLDNNRWSMIKFYEALVTHAHCTSNHGLCMLFEEGTLGPELVDVNKKHCLEVIPYLFYNTPTLAQ